VKPDYIPKKKEEEFDIMGMEARGGPEISTLNMVNKWVINDHKE
jgi:hypothetical protein